MRWCSLPIWLAASPICRSSLPHQPAYLLPCFIAHSPSPSLPIHLLAPLFREHREEEIRLYKKSIKDKGQLEDSTDVADRQPVFLKDKGDALYKQGNFR